MTFVLTAMMRNAYMVAHTYQKEVRVAAPSKQLDQFVVRLPNGMRDALKETAADNGRSMNAEIVFHLRKALGMAAGGGFGNQAPAAESEAAAHPRGETSTR